MKNENNYLLLEYQGNSHADHVKLMLGYYQHSIMGFDKDNKTTTIHSPQLITRKHTPKESKSAYPHQSLVEIQGSDTMI